MVLGFEPTQVIAQLRHERQPGQNAEPGNDRQIHSEEALQLCLPGAIGLILAGFLAHFAFLHWRLFNWLSADQLGL